jgi:hypothetical protein
MPNKKSAKPPQSFSQPGLYQKLNDSTISAIMGNKNDFILNMVLPNEVLVEY